MCLRDSGCGARTLGVRDRPHRGNGRTCANEVVTAGIVAAHSSCALWDFGPIAGTGLTPNLPSGVVRRTTERALGATSLPSPVEVRCGGPLDGSREIMLPFERATMAPPRRDQGPCARARSRMDRGADHLGGRTHVTLHLPDPAHDLIPPGVRCAPSGAGADRGNPTQTGQARRRRESPSALRRLARVAQDQRYFVRSSMAHSSETGSSWPPCIWQICAALRACGCGG